MCVFYTYIYIYYIYIYICIYIHIFILVFVCLFNYLGIAADLYDEYEVGKVITWWTVSSTTADEAVARGFMSQLGVANVLQCVPSVMKLWREASCRN